MRHPHPSSSPAPSRVRRAATALAVTLGLLAIYSCSLIVETRDTQCQADADCASFASGAKCDMTRHICVGPSTSSSSSGTTSSSSSTSTSGMTCDRDGGIEGGGCYACTPTDDTTLLNHCTDGCIPFDDKRVTKVVGGKLPPLPNPGPDGGM